MKYTSKLILLCLAFSSLFGFVSANGNCTEAYLKRLGMIYEDDDTTKQKVFLTSYILMGVGSKMAFKHRATHEMYFEALKLGFAQAELDEDQNACIRCFSDSTKCVVKNCKSYCMANPCRRPCQKCIERNCKQKLLECTGQSDLVNPCRWEDEYRSFKPTLKGIFPDEEEGASGGASGVGSE